ncbi:MAG: HEAT repeat domain-containing protein, partial [Planctomycetaceae bacterium]|nr:HEAT repeat domain-containing protein [Planctomycetaceae bacterium]
KQRYPQLPWCFPMVLPITTFQIERGERDLFRFLRDRLIELGGETLDEVFVERWAAGQCLVLLDGLDEVADVAGRIAAARGVDELLQTVNGNRVVVTTRPVGYNITRLSVPAEHYLLEPFSPQDIATFVRQWYLAHDRAMRPETPNPQQAEADAQSLIDDVQKNPGVGTLATNPLMLTIIALIKHQNVVLPERRVELYEIALNTLLRSWNRARSLSKRPVGEEPKLEKTKKVWAAVAYWMHANVSRTISEAKLHERLVEVLMQEFHEPQHQADDIATSYLEAAKNRSGLLEARGPSTFAFVHQTFQEYLAAIHLALPTRKAVEKILQHAQDPRWHEVIRLAAGYIVIHQTDYDTLRDLMNAFLEDDDPLEPYLATSLRLAAACISDDIGVQTTESDRVVVKIFEYLTERNYGRLQEAFLKALSTLRVVPGESAIGPLCQATEHTDLRVQVEATRLLARLSVPIGQAPQTLKRLFEKDGDSVVKAHAAWGLWQSNQRRDHAVAARVARGMSSDLADTNLDRHPTLLPVLFELLKDRNGSVRTRAASVLWRWGHQAHALPVLIELLKDVSSAVRIQAAEVLGRWGHQAQAVPVLVELLKDAKNPFRVRAVDVLRGRGSQAQAVPTLVELLNDAYSQLLSVAAEVLGRWGHQAQAVPTLVELLKDADRGVRFLAAKALGDWGHQSQAVSVLVELLKDAHANVRFRAAEVLAAWDPQAQAVPVLVKLLKDPDFSVRNLAAKALGGWGHQDQAVPVLVELLKVTDRNVSLVAKWVLGSWGKDKAVVQPLVAKLFRTKGDAEVVAKFLLAAANDGVKQRSAKISQLLAKGLKPNARDSHERRALREILFRWTLDALAITA